MIETKTIVFFMWPASWKNGISLFHCFDSNLFLTDYALQELRNIWLLLFENYSKSITIQGDHWRNNIFAVITHARVIKDNLKKQIKNRKLFTCRLFLLIWIFQYISNWSKFCSSLCRFVHNFDWLFFIYHS